MDAEVKPRGGMKQKLEHELKEFAVISLYFYICFAAILFYKATVLQAEGIGYAPFGLAVVKALILGKFVLLGHAAHVGERFAQKPLIYPALYSVGHIPCHADRPHRGGGSSHRAHSWSHGRPVRRRHRWRHLGADCRDMLPVVA